MTKTSYTPILIRYSTKQRQEVPNGEVGQHLRSRPTLTTQNHSTFPYHESAGIRRSSTTQGAHKYESYPLILANHSGDLHLPSTLTNDMVGQRMGSRTTVNTVSKHILGLLQWVCASDVEIRITLRIHVETRSNISTANGLATPQESVKMSPTVCLPGVHRTSSRTASVPTGANLDQQPTPLKQTQSPE